MRGDISSCPLTGVAMVDVGHHKHFDGYETVDVEKPEFGCQLCKEYRESRLRVALRAADFKAVYGPSWKAAAREQTRTGGQLPPANLEYRIAAVVAMTDQGFRFERAELEGVGIREVYFDSHGGACDRRFVELPDWAIKALGLCDSDGEKTQWRSAKDAGRIETLREGADEVDRLVR